PVASSRPLLRCNGPRRLPADGAARDPGCASTFLDAGGPDARGSGRIGPVARPSPPVGFGAAGAAAGSPGSARRAPAAEVAGAGAGVRSGRLVGVADPADGVE